MKPSVLLTGVARSGTTLACELLNKLPDTVALDEPLSMETLTEPPDPPLVCDRIAEFLTRTRESLLTHKTATSWHVGGKVSAGKFADDRDEEGLRTALQERGELRIDKPLSEEFMLVAKHPAAFTAILEPLAERFEVFAVIRNPLPVLRSWQRIPLRLRDGHHLAAEALDPSLRAALAAIEDRLERQLHLLGWFYEKYRATLPPHRLIRYESLVETGGRALSTLNERAAELDEPLENRNRGPSGSDDDTMRVAERLLATDGAYWSFYSKESVSDLIAG